MPSTFKNLQDHRFLAQDELYDCSQNIAYWLGQNPQTGSLASGSKAITTAASSAISGTETIVVKTPLVLPNTAQQTLGSLNVGSRIVITGGGTVTATAAVKNNVFTIRAGTTGTTSDQSVGTFTVASVAAGTGVGFSFMLDLVVQTLGATGTCAGIGQYNTSSLAGTQTAGNDVTVHTVSGTNLATTTATFLSVSYTGFTTDLVSTFAAGASIVIYP